MSVKIHSVHMKICSAQTLAREGRRFVLPLLFATLALAAGAGLLGVSGWFVTAAGLTTAGIAFNLFAPSAGVRGLSFVRIVARYGERVTGHDATLRLLSDIRSNVFERLFPLVPLRETALRRGELVSRLVADVEALDALFISSIVPVVAALAITALMTAVLAWQVPGAAPAYAACSLAAILVVPGGFLLLSGAPARRAGRAAAALRIAALQAMDGHRDLVANDATGWAAERIDDAAQALASARKQLATLSLLGSALVQALGAAALAALLWPGVAAVSSGALDGPVLAGLALAVLGGFEAQAALVRGVGKLGGAIEAARRLDALAEIVPAIAEPAAPFALPEGADFRLEHVSFGYEPGRPVLDDISLAVEAGQRVALIGASGAGKSTLLALLLRLADPTTGHIMVAGAELRRVELASLRSRVALLEQDAPVFMDTIRANLLIGRPGASDAELWQALEAARLADVVRNLPHGLDSYVGEAGRTLSAGQARRLCLARVLVSPARIILLDEPTSGLDRETETAFLADLPAATAGRTLLIATHANLPPGAVDAGFEIIGGQLRRVQ